MATAPTLDPTSAQLARHLERNPHNFHDARYGGGLPAIWINAARFEAEGRKGYPHDRNPYSAGTMANEHWAKGWHQADNAACARTVYESGAVLVANCDWRTSEDGRTLAGGWLVAATYRAGSIGADYYHRAAFAQWWAPAEHRNDGARVTETAAEKGMRLGADAAAAALREFAALPDLAIRLMEAR